MAAIATFLLITCFATGFPVDYKAKLVVTQVHEKDGKLTVRFGIFTKRDIMKTCIICREEKQDFNKEHLIPDAIGGSLVTFSVCVDCNSLLGAKVDAALTNHFSITMKKMLLGMADRNGDVKDPLIGVLPTSDNPSKKLRIQKDQTGKYYASELPSDKVKKHDDGSATIQIKLAKSDEHLLQDHLEKILTRKLNQTADAVTIEQGVTTYSISNDPVQVTKSFVTDWIGITLAQIKMAYELAVDAIPGYFDDARAIEISSLLKQGAVPGNDVGFFGANRYELSATSLFELFEYALGKEILDLKDDNHYILLTSLPPFGLLAFVNIFDIPFLTRCFVLSTSTKHLPLNSGILLRNNVKNRKCCVESFIYDGLTITED